MSGVVHLIPVPLAADTPPERVLPTDVLAQVRGLRMFAAENPKSARAFLKAVPHPAPIQSLRIETLDSRTPEADIDRWLDVVETGEDIGVLSEAGCPGVADPGAALVGRAHRRGIAVCPRVGPSSLLLALMASGLEGQRFAFHGYLPSRDPQRQQVLKSLERRSRENRETQIFIETPYRNEAMFDALMAACSSGTHLCIAADLGSHREAVNTRTIAQWRALERPGLRDRPAVFLLLA